VALSQLQLIHAEASQQQPHHSRISLSAQGVAIYSAQQLLSLIARQPIANPPPKLPHASDSTDARRQFGTQPAALSRFICQAPNRREMKIDCGR